MENLRASIRQYTAIDNRIIEANRRLHELREERKILELQIVDVLKQPAYASFQKLSVADDGSTIKVHRPGWNKSWSLSQTMLQRYIREYFEGNARPNANDCIKHIVDRNRQELVSQVFCLERSVAKTD